MQSLTPDVVPMAGWGNFTTLTLTHLYLAFDSSLVLYLLQMTACSWQYADPTAEDLHVIACSKGTEQKAAAGLQSMHQPRPEHCSTTTVSLTQT